MSASLDGIGVMGYLRNGRLEPAQVIGAHQAREQQHGGEFHADHVGPVEGDADELGSDGAGGGVNRGAA
jgi:hypothetical protein